MQTAWIPPTFMTLARTYKIALAAEARKAQKLNAKCFSPRLSASVVKDESSDLTQRDGGNFCPIGKVSLLFGEA